jgi:alpha-D-ribose 1-methylphosphonate 5-triphosphate synthase subunit PhnG
VHVSDAGELAALQRDVDGIPEEAAARVAAALAAMGIEVETPPRTALVMMTVTDPFATDFHLGEVLVTEAVVRVGSQRGWGLSVGDVPQRALLKAALDALASAGDRRALDRLRALLAPEVARAEGTRAEEAARVAATRVQFDLMPGS